MDNFLAELKRRHVFRVGAAYVVVAWALIQVIDILSQIFDLPSSIAQPAVVLLAIGFPVALVVAWTIESKPHETVAAAVRSKPTIVDWALCGALVVVIALVSYQQLSSSPGGRTAQQQASIAPTAASQLQPGGISIAVLPFANLSSDTEQEFFSDGMTEEITAALARIPNLRMVGRTSAFQFKGQNKDLRAIGQSLGAIYLIEGSVRKAGDRVRVTAQLVKVEDGIGLWTNNYDRELKDIFATQEDIAQAIAGALRVPLGLQQGETLVSNRTDDVESYQLYLRARALYRARAIIQTIALLEPAVARDRSYPPAWALLAQAYTLAPVFTESVLAGPIEEERARVQSSLDKADMAAREAIRLDPRHPGGYAALGYIQTERSDWGAADDSFRRALALDSDDPDTLHFYSLALASLGRLKEGLSVREQLQTLEPFVPIYNIFYALLMQLNGQSEATIPILEATPLGGAVNFVRNNYLAKAYATAGRYADAADTLLAIPTNTIPLSRQSVEDAARLLRSAPAKASAPGVLPTLPAFQGDLSFVYAFIGAPERVLEGPERLLEIGYPNAPPTWALWHPLSAPLRKTERFKAFARKAGMVDYWRARGWPDLCRPVGADDFVCD